MEPHPWGVSSSGQTKHIFCRNTKTETMAPGKAEISAETQILAKSLFRPK